MIKRKVKSFFRHVANKDFNALSQSVGRLFNGSTSKSRDGRVTKKLRLRKILKKYYDLELYQTQEKKIQVCIVANDADIHPKSSAFIRLISPLTSAVAKSQINLSIVRSLESVKPYTDVVIIQRIVTTNEDSVDRFLNLLLENNMRLIIDIDDAFFHADKNLKSYDRFTKGHNLLLHLAKYAYKIWVSTDKLHEYYSKHTKTSVQIVQNTLDNRLWNRLNTEYTTPATNRLELLYMGTATHNEDFLMIVPWLDKLHEMYPNKFRLSLIGITNTLPDKPWLVSIDTSSVSSIYPCFVDWMKYQGPFDIGLSPLISSSFNKYKSDIKCLDYLAIGATPMVSAVEAYKSKDLDKYIIRNKNTEKEWIDSLEEAINNLARSRSDFKNQALKNKKFLQNKRSSENTAKIMLKDIL